MVGTLMHGQLDEDSTYVIWADDTTEGCAVLLVPESEAHRMAGALEVLLMNAPPTREDYSIFDSLRSLECELRTAKAWKPEP